MINAEAWKTMGQHAPGSVEGVLSAVASAGDIDSVASALDAGLATSKPTATCADRLDAVLRLADLPLDGSRRAQADVMLKRWLAEVPQKTLDDALYKIADSRDVRPFSCRLLVTAGADPYKTPPGSDACALRRAFTRRQEEALEIVQGIIGTEPIANIDRLPRKIRYIDDNDRTERWNLLEFASIIGHVETSQWLISQIDRNSPADRLAFDLGRGALKRLFLEENGTPQTHMPTMPVEDKYLVQGFRMLIGGAQFKDLNVWKSVANRPISTAVRGESILFTVAGDPEQVNWENAPHNVALLVDTLLRHEALDVNAFGGDGKTLLMIACERVNIDLIKVLLDHGADPLLRMQTAKIGKRKLNSIQLAKSFCDDAVVQMLEATGARQAVNEVLAKAKRRVPGGGNGS